jgi:hypothetical protein
VRLEGVALLHHCSIRASLNDANSRFVDPIAPTVLCFRNPGCVVLSVEQVRYIWLATLVRRSRGVAVVVGRRGKA